jgi:hypothetical protein
MAGTLASVHQTRPDGVRSAVHGGRLLDACRGPEFAAAPERTYGKPLVGDQTGWDAKKSSKALSNASGLPWFIACEVPGMVTRWACRNVRSSAPRIRA